VKGKAVVVASTSENVTLGFAESSIPEETESDPRTARFVENYYRGFGESPMDVFSANDESDADRSGENLRFPMQRYNQLRDDGAPMRYEIYRDGSRGAGTGVDATPFYESIDETPADADLE
jgi:hypothetical protein